MYKVSWKLVRAIEIRLDNKYKGIGKIELVHIVYIDNYSGCFNRG